MKGAIMGMDTVLAAVLAAPGEIRIQRFPYPTSLEADALIVKMEMAGVCGTDKHIYNSTGSHDGVPYPVILGHENVGTIVEIGPGTSKTREFDGQSLRPGDRIVISSALVCGECWYCRNTFGYAWCERVQAFGWSFSCAAPPHLLGGWAEYMYIPPKASVYRVPEGVPPEAAVLAEPFTCSFAIDSTKEFYSLANTGFGAAPTVVVQGVGPLGLCCLIKSRILGAGEIIAIDVSDYRLNMAKRFGADHCLNPARTTSEERIEFVKERTHGRGADLVVECVGVPKVLVEGIEMVRRAGTYVEAGVFMDSGEVSLNVSRHICIKNIRLLGASYHPLTGYRATLKLMEKYGDIIPFDQIVTHRFPIDKAEDALKTAMKGECLKAVLTGKA